MSAMSVLEQDHLNALKSLAEETLSAFDDIANAARERLEQAGPRRSLDVFASINRMTDESAIRALGGIQQGREIDCRTLLSGLRSPDSL